MKNKHQFIFVAFLFSMLQSSVVAARDQSNSYILSLKPKECVVFKEGDKCYASVKVKWKTNIPGALCLFRTPGDVKLECWATGGEGEYTENLVMIGPVDYYLVSVASSEILIKKKLYLSWVYEKSSRLENTWRLF